MLTPWFRAPTGARAPAGASKLARPALRASLDGELALAALLVQKSLRRLGPRPKGASRNEVGAGPGA